MCGRFVLNGSLEKIGHHFNIEAFDIEMSLNLPNYNISPASIMPVIINDIVTLVPKIVAMKWGLVPSWSRDNGTTCNMINARIETIEQKPAFRQPFRSQRCLIPATGFYEWDKNIIPKQPTYIYLKDQNVFSFGGIYDKIINHETNKILYTFSIITMPANAKVTSVHDRMPLVIEPINYKLWLGNQVLQISDKENILKASKELPFEMHQVSRAVNAPQNNYIELLL